MLFAVAELLVLTVNMAWIGVRASKTFVETKLVISRRENILESIQ